MVRENSDIHKAVESCESLPPVEYDVVLYIPQYIIINEFLNSEVVEGI